MNNSPLNTHDETISSRWPVPGSQSLLLWLMPPFVLKLLFIVISHSSIFHSWREFLCSIVWKEANCPWHWTKCSAWLRPLLNVLIAAGCTLTAIHAPLTLTLAYLLTFSLHQFFAFTASSFLYLLFWPLLYLQHTMARHQGQRCFTAKPPLPCFIDIHAASCYDDQDMIMQCRMLLRPFVWRPRVGGVFRPRCLYQ